MNTFKDLNMILHQQLERLDDPDLTAEDMKFESERTKAIVDVSSEIISVNRLALDIAKNYANGHVEQNQVDFFLGDGSDG